LDDSAEIWYYVLSKLDIFSYQKNYGERVSMEVVLDKIGRFGSDRFVAYKALSLIISLTNNSKQA